MSERNKIEKPKDKDRDRDRDRDRRRAQREEEDRRKRASPDTELSKKFAKHNLDDEDKDREKEAMETSSHGKVAEAKDWHEEQKEGVNSSSSTHPTAVTTHVEPGGSDATTAPGASVGGSEATATEPALPPLQPPPNTRGVEPTERKSSDTDSRSRSSTPDLIEQDIQGLADANTQSLLRRMFRENSRNNEDLYQRQQRTGYAVRALQDQVTDLQANRQSVALAYPPRGWKVPDVKNLILSMFAEGAFAGIATGLAAESEVPLQIVLVSVGTFGECYNRVSSRSGGEIRLQLKQSTKVFRQDEQCAYAKNQMILISKQHAREKNTAEWTFLPGYPLQRRWNSESESWTSDDNWSMEIVWEDKKDRADGVSVTKVVLNCLYDHTLCKQEFLLSREVLLREMEWSAPEIEQLIRNIPRLYESTITWTSSELPQLGKRKQREAQQKGAAKGNTDTPQSLPMANLPPWNSKSQSSSNTKGQTKGSNKGSYGGGKQHNNFKGGHQYNFGDGGFGNFAGGQFYSNAGTGQQFGFGNPGFQNFGGQMYGQPNFQKGFGKRL